MTPPCFIIAEAGVNHNGDLRLALELVDLAAAAGADAVKFQSFKAASLATSTAPKANYQTSEPSSQLEMLKSLELSDDSHRQLAARAQTLGIQFLSTPFDLESLRFLTEELSLKTIKIPSGEITNGPLLLAAARSAERIILSTGMSTLDEVGTALAVLRLGMTHADTSIPGKNDLLPVSEANPISIEHAERVTLLHCTTAYPTPPEDANLHAMQALREAFGTRIGYSDHTLGNHVAVAAVALGASVIEKHFTLDRDLPGPDHNASCDPDELHELVRVIRATTQSLGSPQKQITPSEASNLNVARKSLVAKQPIQQGECFSVDNVDAKRPGGGISPIDYWNILGTPAKRDYGLDDQLEY